MSSQTHEVVVGVMPWQFNLLSNMLRGCGTFELHLWSFDLATVQAGVPIRQLTRTRQVAHT